ncbi:MAG: methionyl-tRNA synthetase [Frankiaceae bacterium]|nr:methionyl-tRNA synthetase [Frankiaceae bacterium]
MPSADSSDEPASFFLTTPIYYVNDAPHIGHAYTTVAGDVLTRWHRQRGERVHFLTGTDEHGTKVERTAQAAGVSPQEWCDRLVEDSWKPVLRTVDAANDDFIRTTEPRHEKGVQRFWEVLREAGHCYASTYEGPYCVGCEEFKLPGDLLEGGLCPVHGTPVEMLSEENWFFRLSAFSEALLAHYEANPTAVQPESAYNEVVSFIKQGLQDISMSRSSVAWGVPLPWDASQVVYVWFDALLNYATAVGFGTDDERFAQTWPADVHLVGKDILRFHAIYWPAMLLAAGLPLPRQVFAHGWLLVGGEKMSKTKLTGIAPSAIVDHFGSDAFRYYFLRAIPFGSDGSFSWEDMSARYKSELADQFGNLASRLTSMVERYRDGVLPAPVPNEQLSAALQQAASDADTAIDVLDLQSAINAAMGFVRTVNNYVTETEPWKLAKDEARAGDLDAVLYCTAESLRAAAVLLNPVIPKACSVLWSSLGAEAQLGPISEQRVDQVARWGQLPAGARVTKSDPLFPRLDELSDAGGRETAPGG